MTASILPNAVTQFIDGNGKPLAGGSVYFYIPNTSTFKNTYQDSAQTILNTNPVVLDANGEAIIWGSGTYRQVVYDVNSNLVWDRITQDPNASITGNMTDDLFVAGTDFTPGVTTSLTLTSGPGSLSNLWVFFDGVFQDDTGLTLSGSTTLIFNAPIPIGVSLVTVKIGSSNAIGTPSNGTVVDASVAVNAGIQSRKLSYQFQAIGTTNRTIYSKLSEWISVKDFGAVGDGVADDTAAFNAAISYANSRNPGDVGDININGITIFVPDGRYNITAPVSPILKGGIAIRGQSQDGARLILSYNGPTFTWNNTGSASYVVTGSFSDMTIEYSSTPPANAMVWYLEQSFRIIFRNINLVNVCRIMQLGSGSRICGAISLENVIGYVYNGGQPAIIPASGAGLFLSNCHLFVGGVNAPPIDRTTLLTTVPGTNFIQCDSSTWDTIQITGCTVERFYYGIYCNATSGIILNNFYVANTYFDFHAAHAVFFSSLAVGAGGIFSMKFTGCWFATWDDSAVAFQGPGAIRFIEFDNCTVISAGSYGYFIDGINTSGVQIKGGTVAGTNRLNVGASAVALNAGTKVTISGLLAGLDSTPDGFPWQAIYGLAISANLDGYTVTDCEFAGATAPVLLGANSSGSQNRIVKNNRNTNFQNTVVTPSVSSGVAFVNTFPYAIRFNTFGGTVSGISFNGNGINGSTSGQFIMNPGDSITITYSVSPSFSYSGIN